MGKRNAVEITSLDEFKHWGDSASRGAWACYFEGDLASNRIDGVASLGNKLGAYAWQLYQSGQFLLAQQRAPGGKEGVFRYYIVRRR